MFKVIHIEGKPIKMKSDGGTARLYRQYFKKDFLSEIQKLGTKEGEADIAEMLENLAWTMAKRADDSIPDIDEWLGRFQSPMSIYEKANDIFNMLTVSQTSIVDPKKKNRQKSQ